MNTKQLRQKILDLAIHGKLVPQDPNDEPASVLLKRIAAEKERLAKEGKIKRGKKASASPTSDDKSHYGQLPFIIPSNWTLVELGKICDISTGPFGTMLHQSDYVKEGIPLVNPQNITEKGIIPTKFVSEKTAKQLHTYQIYKDDIVIGRRGEMGRCTVISEPQNGWLCGTGCFIIKSSAVFYAPFLAILIGSEYSRSYLQNNSIGATMSNLNHGILKSMQLPLPPFAEQHRIVAAIESAFSIIDEIEQNKTDLQSAIITVKSKILSLAISGKLVPQDPNDEPASVLLERIHKECEVLAKAGKIKHKKNDSVITKGDHNSYYGKVPFKLPESWEWYRLADFWTLLSGRDLTPSEYSDMEIGIPYITGASNFVGSSLIINRWTVNPKVIAINGDLLITCKGTVGAMIINTHGNIHIARQIMAIRNQADLSIDFLKIVMTAFVIQITSASKGIIPGIGREDVLNMLIPCPSLNEQNRIAATVKESHDVLDKILRFLN